MITDKNPYSRESKSNGRRSSILKRQDSCFIPEGTDGNTECPRTPRRVSFASTATVRYLHISSGNESSDTSSASSGSSQSMDRDSVFAEPPTPFQASCQGESAAHGPSVFGKPACNSATDIEIGPIKCEATSLEPGKNKTVFYTSMNMSLSDIFLSDMSEDSICQDGNDEINGDSVPMRQQEKQNHTILYTESDQHGCCMDLTSNISQLSESVLQESNSHLYNGDCFSPEEPQNKPGLKRRPSFADGGKSESRDDQAFVRMYANSVKENVPDCTIIFGNKGGEEMEFTQHEILPVTIRPYPDEGKGGSRDDQAFVRMYANSVKENVPDCTIIFANKSGEEMEFTEHEILPVTTRPYSNETFSTGITLKPKPKLLDDLFQLVKQKEPNYVATCSTEGNLTQGVEDMEFTKNISQVFPRTALSDITTHKILPAAHQSVPPVVIQVPQPALFSQTLPPLVDQELPDTANRAVSSVVSRAKTPVVSQTVLAGINQVLPTFFTQELSPIVNQPVPQIDSETVPLISSQRVSPVVSQTVVTVVSQTVSPIVSQELPTYVSRALPSPVVKQAVQLSASQIVPPVSHQTMPPVVSPAVPPVTHQTASPDRDQTLPFVNQKLLPVVVQAESLAVDQAESPIVDQIESPTVTDDTVLPILVNHAYIPEGSFLSDLESVNKTEQMLCESVSLQDLYEILGISRLGKTHVKSVPVLKLPAATSKEKLIAKTISMSRLCCLKQHLNEIEAAINRSEQECTEKLIQFSDNPPEILAAFQAKENNVSDLRTKAQAVVNSCRILAQAMWKRYKIDYHMRYSETVERACRAIDLQTNEMVSSTERALDLAEVVDKCLLKVDLILGQKQELTKQQVLLEESEREVQKLKGHCKHMDDRVVTCTEENKDGEKTLTSLDITQESIEERLSWMNSFTEWTVLNKSPGTIQFGFLFNSLVLAVDLNNHSSCEQISRVNLHSRLAAGSKPWAKLAHHLIVLNVNCKRLQANYPDYHQMHQLLRDVSAIVCDFRQFSMELKRAHLKHSLTIDDYRLKFTVSNRKTRQKITLDTTLVPNYHPHNQLVWTVTTLIGSVSSQDVKSSVDQIVNGPNYMTRVLSQTEKLLAVVKR